jgi:hypothetical protein
MTKLPNLSFLLLVPAALLWVSVSAGAKDSSNSTATSPVDAARGLIQRVVPKQEA